MYMATKTISILEEAYNALIKEKGKGDSFSDVILKLTRRKGKLKDSFGSWNMTDKDVTTFRRELRDAWTTSKKRYA